MDPDPPTDPPTAAAAITVDLLCQMQQIRAELADLYSKAPRSSVSACSFSPSSTP